MLSFFSQMDSSTNSSSSSPALCLDIERSLRDSAFSIIFWLHSLLQSITLLSIPILVRQYFKLRILVHGNLLFLFANILLLLFLFTLPQFIYLLRYRLILFNYTDPCQFLTPLWMVSFFYGPAYAHSIAYPAFHFCVMIERVRATLLAIKYEGEGQRLGIWMAAGIWSISLGYTAFVIWAASTEREMAIQGLIYLNSKKAGQVVISVQYVALLLIIITAFCDWRITQMNRRIRVASRNGGGGMTAYSLSRNYQVNENVLAMRLILPLDTAYALLYSVFTALVIVNRSYRTSQQISTIQYTLYYSYINTLIFLYSAITILVYIRFMNFVRRCQERDVSQKRGDGGTSQLEPEARIYFRQLEQQWA